MPLAKFSRVVFLHGGKKKTLSAKAKETISAKKGTAMACDVSHEVIVAGAGKCSQWKGFSENPAVTRGP